MSEDIIELISGFVAAALEHEDVDYVLNGEPVSAELLAQPDALLPLIFSGVSVNATPLEGIDLGVLNCLQVEEDKEGLFYYRLTVSSEIPCKGSRFIMASLFSMVVEDIAARAVNGVVEIADIEFEPKAIQEVMDMISPDMNVGAANASRQESNGP